ncbi:MAG: hypothetical protein WA139_00825 [Candidatus Aenigmatarchaeota archaeon]
MESCKPYTTVVLEEIKNKSSSLQLWEIGKALNSLSGAIEIIFSYIAERNKNGNAPTYKSMRKSENITISRPTMEVNINNLLKKKMIINPSSVEILQVFGQQEKCNGWKLPEYIENKFPDLKLWGNHGSTYSFTKKFDNPRATAYERYFIALAEKDGLPVYSKIFYE